MLRVCCLLLMRLRFGVVLCFCGWCDWRVNVCVCVIVLLLVFVQFLLLYNLLCVFVVVRMHVVCSFVLFRCITVVL